MEIFLPKLPIDYLNFDVDLDIIDDDIDIIDIYFKGKKLNDSQFQKVLTKFENQFENEINKRYEKKLKEVIADFEIDYYL